MGKILPRGLDLSFDRFGSVITAPVHTMADRWTVSTEDRARQPWKLKQAFHCLRGPPVVGLDYTDISVSESPLSAGPT